MTKERLEQLRNIAAPTWEGVLEEGLDEQLKQIDSEVKYEICSGKDMNEAYNLTDDNRYPDDLSIVILTKWSIDMMIWKFEYGCRWLDDVIDNNIRREEAKNGYHFTECQHISFR